MDNVIPKSHVDLVVEQLMLLHQGETAARRDVHQFIASNHDDWQRIVNGEITHEKMAEHIGGFFGGW
jgi:hypothetical protein